jgi:uncharacterized protein YyaL (SSP411 family)
MLGEQVLALTCLRRRRGPVEIGTLSQGMRCSRPTSRRCAARSRVFREEPERIAKNHDALMRRLAAAQRGTAGDGGPAGLDVPRPAAMVTRQRRLARNARFPQCAGISGARTGERQQLLHLWLSLVARMPRRHFDHLGSGFSRYSVDERWLVPHFEKMLYDNAQLLELLALAHRRSGNPLFRERAQETVGWLEREMVTAEGAFAASLDADSEGEEGKFYVWSLHDIERVLGPSDAAFFDAHYDVTPQGNFEGHNILTQLWLATSDASRLCVVRSGSLKRAGRCAPDSTTKSRRLELG